MARPLPERDMRALFDVVVVILGQIVAGEAPPELTARIIRRLAKDGYLASNASVGELAAVGRRSMPTTALRDGAYDTLPEPSRRETSYTLALPTEQAAHACEAEATAMGALATSVTAADEGWRLLARLPDLPPDPSFRDWVTQLQALARRHGGQYAGAQS